MNKLTELVELAFIKDELDAFENSPKGGPTTDKLNKIKALASKGDIAINFPDHADIDADYRSSAARGMSDLDQRSSLESKLDELESENDNTQD